jgi:hypothetical protein
VTLLFQVWFWLALAGVVLFFVSLAQCSPAIQERNRGELNAAPPRRLAMGPARRGRRNVRRGQLGRWLVIQGALS